MNSIVPFRDARRLVQEAQETPQQAHRRAVQYLRKMGIDRGDEEPDQDPDEEEPNQELSLLTVSSPHCLTKYHNHSY